AYRDLPFRTEIANSITLSTFHGTPADEIEHICEFLLAEMDYHVIIKMNPPMLGKERIEYLLHEKLGYTDVEVNENIYKVNINFPDAVGVVRRLQKVAARRRKKICVKFGNTLEVLNKGKFLKDKIQYLSGQPLHVLHLALVDEWRKVFGADFPISFAAGVDANNFADCVAIGLVPITTCTDLLRPGGYGRLPQYLFNLERSMKEIGAGTIEEYMVKSEIRNPKFQTNPIPTKSGQIPNLKSAVLKNTSNLLEKSINNPRYHYSGNKKPPRKIGSHLHLWDCINCDKCIPVCPNDANFYFEVEPFEIQYKNIEIVNDTWREVEGGIFKIEEKHQIATFADACNDCGNCDVFCPEDGGPYIEKPRFFGSLDSWQRWKALGGFFFTKEHDCVVLYGRFKKNEYRLILETQQKARFHCDSCSMILDWETGKILGIEHQNSSENIVVDMAYYLTMETLLKGMMDANRVHFVNVGFIK
ncbi:MAG TPA: 4Fe-4S dicluster domain-containing protein, partial [Bacteroidota bacterium]|nr:4Fe-4S dicluster domain-containing protein [Bacteroidota bacterium]